MLRPAGLIAVLGLLAVPLAAAPRVVAADVDGVVHPITVEIIARAIEQARSENATCILIRLNTPGGMLDATREAIEKMVASPVPVVTYVTPSGGRAASAGFFLLEAGDVAAMAPGTNTGAASPVMLNQQMEPVMRAKIENDSAALLRNLTARRGRNSDLAEKTIREARAFTDKESLDNHLIEIVAASERALLDQINGREVVRFNGARQKLNTAGAEVVVVSLTWRERLVSAISDPNIGFILLVLGGLGLYVEFQSPGLIFPGVAGAVLVMLGLSSLAVLPINWVGVVLLILAAAMFVLEAKVASHGILGTGATVSMVLGAVLLVDGPPEVRIRLSTALAVSLPFALITMFLVSIVVRARRNKVVTGIPGMLDEIGVARTDLSPAGKVFVHGEHWDAVSSAPLPEGSRVRVIAVDGLTLRVEPLK
ncbi:MAG: nodulation protein NfeD [Bryobacteraceae bacterium]